VVGVGEPRGELLGSLEGVDGFADLAPHRQAAMKASYSLGYLEASDGGLVACRQAAELVGVAGFEPAASSSRTTGKAACQGRIAGLQGCSRA
jgi:hypothetical protein